MSDYPEYSELSQNTMLGTRKWEADGYKTHSKESSRRSWLKWGHNVRYAQTALERPERDVISRMAGECVGKT